MDAVTGDVTSSDVSFETVGETTFFEDDPGTLIISGFSCALVGTVTTNAISGDEPPSDVPSETDIEEMIPDPTVVDATLALIVLASSSK